MVYEILDVLTQILGMYKKYSNGEYYFNCTFCHHHKQKLAVNLTKRKWQCWKCGAKGSTLLSLLRKLDVSQNQIKILAVLLADELPGIQTSIESEPTLVLPEEFISLGKTDLSQSSTPAMNYLWNRGLTRIDIIRYNIGYCDSGLYANRIIVPSYDAAGVLNYFVGRTWRHGQLNYVNPHISKNVIGFENFVNWKYPLVLCEGVFDAMSIKRNAIPLLGKTVSRKLQAKIMTENVTDIYLALDNDALKATLKIAEVFMRENINVYLVDLPNKDPSEMGFTASRQYINEAHKLTFADLISLKLKLI